LRGKFDARSACDADSPQSCPKAVRIEAPTRRRDGDRRAALRRQMFLQTTAAFSK
jgi:hypothetical protein